MPLCAQKYGRKFRNSTRMTQIGRINTDFLNKRICENPSNLCHPCAIFCSHIKWLSAPLPFTDPLQNLRESA